MRKYRQPLPSRVREQVIFKFESRCGYCRERLGDSQIEIDHIFPVSRGGSDQIDNLACACRRCNENKGNDISGIDFYKTGIYRIFHPNLQCWEKHFSPQKNAHPKGVSEVGRVTQNLLWGRSKQTLFETSDWPYASRLRDAKVKNSLNRMNFAQEAGYYERYQEIRQALVLETDSYEYNDDYRKIILLIKYLDVKISVRRSSISDIKSCIMNCLDLCTYVSKSSTIYRDVINHLGICYKQLCCIFVLEGESRPAHFSLAMYFSSLFNRDYLNVKIDNNENDEYSFNVGRRLRNWAVHAQFNKSFMPIGVELFSTAKNAVLQTSPGYNQDALRFISDYMQEFGINDPDFKIKIANDIDKEVEKIGFSVGKYGMMSSYIVRRSTFLHLSIDDRYVSRLSRDLEYFFHQELYNEIRESLRSYIVLKQNSNRSTAVIRSCFEDFLKKIQSEKYVGTLTRSQFLRELETLKKVIYKL